MIPAVRIKIGDSDYWWLPDTLDPPNGAIAPLHHCDDKGGLEEFGTSFAHVFDGQVLRYGTPIGVLAPDGTFTAA